MATETQTALAPDQTAEFDGLAPVATISNPAQEFAKLNAEYRDLKDRTEKVKKQMDQIEELVLDQFGELGIKRIGTSDGKTVYLHTETLASVLEDENGSKEQAHAVFRKYGLAYMVKPQVNGNTLKSYITEQKREGNTLPEELLLHIKVTERPRIRVRAG